MEDLNKKGADMNDKEIVFSKSIKAGKRIYYLDVKKNRKDEMFLAITESKKVVTGEGEDAQVSFEKHKIFLYREDFEKFMNGLNEAINFINQKEMLEVMYIQQASSIIILGDLVQDSHIPKNWFIPVRVWLILCTVLNKIMEYSGNVVVNLKKMIEFLRFPVIFLL